MHTRVIDNCCITLAQRLEYQLATILYLVHSRKRPLKKSEYTLVILLRSRLKYISILRSTSISAMLLVENVRNIGKRYQESIHFILGLTGTPGQRTLE